MSPLPASVTPPEIQRRGPNAVRSFHKALREGKQKVPQCKLLVLGEARVGKTSLVRNMSGLKFDPNLDPTRGIENKCVDTMVDSANIDVSKWRSISENEQADRDHGNYLKAIAEVLKTEDPALIEIKAMDDHSDKLGMEGQITEAQLLEYINAHFLLVEQRQMEREKIPRAKRVRFPLDFNRSIPGDLDTWKNADPSSVHESLQVPHSNPPLEVRGNILPKHAVAEKVPSMRVLAPSAPTPPVQRTTPSQPNPQPVALVTQRSRLGRRRARMLYNQLPSVAQKVEEPSLCFEVLDFAGQNVYRPMHHCFMSCRAMYVVVCNLQHLCDKTKSAKHFAELKYWINSIHAHVHNPGSKYQKYIFLVGTHKSPGNGQADITDTDLQTLSKELQNYLFAGNCRFKDEIHFCDNDLIITGLENSMDQSSSGITIIKKEIEIFSKYLPFLAETYPISWLDFKANLIKRKRDGSPILDLEEAKQIAKDCGVQETAVHTALQFFHDIGVIIYPGKCLFVVYTLKTM